MIILIFDAFLYDLVSFLRHLELFLTVDGGVSTHEANSLFLVVLRPTFKLIHELGEWEIDVLGEV